MSGGHCTHPTGGPAIRLKHKKQRERLPKSKMASSDDRFTLEIVRVLRFGNELNKELC